MTDRETLGVLVGKVFNDQWSDLSISTDELWRRAADAVAERVLADMREHLRVRHGVSCAYLEMRMDPVDDD